jgi:hypothetical protein
VFRRLIIAALLAVSIPALPALASRSATPAPGTPLAMFKLEPAAQLHCPSDTVVWLNIQTGVYHEKGMRWYGHTKYGAYVCRQEADAAGDRNTRNGQ